MKTLEEQVRLLFADTGPLWSRPEFERRVQQKEMALAIARTLTSGEHLLVEAPTGVGKTLAYLLPIILFARAENRRAIVSTHTKTLQDQLQFKDIPLAHSVLQIPFSAFALKGRRNYLCTTRMRAAVAAAGSLFVDNQENELQRIFHWSLSTIDGDVGSLGFVPLPEVWAAVCSEPGVCSGATCKSDCFYQRAREKARTADLLIMNHALFFSYLALPDSDEESALAGDCIVFDEAHTIEQVAARTLGNTISRRQLLSLLNRLYSRRTKKGLLAHQGKRTKSLFRNIEEEIDTFFAAVQRAAEQVGSRHSGGGGAEAREIRIRSPHLTADLLSSALEDLQREIERWSDQSDVPGSAQELAVVIGDLEGARAFLHEFLGDHHTGQAYWVDITAPPRDNVALCAAPIDIGSHIGPRLFTNDASVIMTSATLSVGGSFEYVQRRLGAQDAGTFALDSPFDFGRQMRVTLSRTMPEPDSEAYASALSQKIVEAIARSDGKALVLFTSTALMRATARSVRTAIQDQGIRLLVQGVDWDRHVLLEEFRRDIRSVLFGLDSFWMGIDVPGEALEHVIITRLPFSVPNQPLVEARLEDISSRGGNPFMEYSLPEAVLKFRQGVGRLIRSQTDKGSVTILDSRIISKHYGRVFLASLPPCPVEIEGSEGTTDILPRDDW